MGEITYRLAGNKDSEQIISLLNSVFSSQQRSDRVRDLSSWNWKNRENVFEATKIVVAEHEGEIVGTGTLWPFKFQLNGTIHLAYQTCGLGVSERFRRRGVFRNINQFRIETAREKNASFLFSFPNSNSLPGYKKMGWAYLGKLKWYVKPLKPVQILKDLLYNKAGSVPYRLDEKYNLEKNQIKYDSTHVQPDKIELLKSDGYFNWRYGSHPYFQYGFIQHKKEGDVTYGAVVSVLKKGDFKEMVIIDIVSKSFEMTKSIIAEVEKAAAEYGVMYLALVAPVNSQNVDMIFKGYLPYYMKNMTAFTLQPDLKSEVENIKNWSLFAGLHDSI